MLRILSETISPAAKVPKTVEARAECCDGDNGAEATSLQDAAATTTTTPTAATTTSAAATTAAAVTVILAVRIQNDRGNGSSECIDLDMKIQLPTKQLSEQGDSPRVVIGRDRSQADDPSSYVEVACPYMSVDHAALWVAVPSSFASRTAGASTARTRLEGDSFCVLVEDLGSSNGSRLNRTGLAHGAPKRLLEGDSLRFADGRVVARVVAISPAPGIRTRRHFKAATAAQRAQRQLATVGPPRGLQQCEGGVSLVDVLTVSGDSVPDPDDVGSQRRKPKPKRRSGRKMCSKMESGGTSQSAATSKAPQQAQGAPCIRQWQLDTRKALQVDDVVWVLLPLNGDFKPLPCSARCAGGAGAAGKRHSSMVSLTLASAKKRIRTHGWVAVVRPGPYGPLSGVRLRLVGIDSRGDTNDADKCGPVLSLDDEMCWNVLPIATGTSDERARFAAVAARAVQEVLARIKECGRMGGSCDCHHRHRATNLQAAIAAVDAFAAAAESPSEAAAPIAPQKKKPQGRKGKARAGSDVQANLPNRSSDQPASLLSMLSEKGVSEQKTSKRRKVQGKQCAASSGEGDAAMQSKSAKPDSTAGASGAPKNDADTDGWTSSERKRLADACAGAFSGIHPGRPNFWGLVAKHVNFRGKGEPQGHVRAPHECQSKWQSRFTASTNATQTKASGSPGDATLEQEDEMEAIKKQKLAGKRTAKRAQQVRAYLEARDRGHEDDIFAATDSAKQSITAGMESGQTSSDSNKNPLSLQAALSPWIPRSKSADRRESSLSVGMALPSPSVFADMIFDDSGDESPENMSEKKSRAISQATPVHSRCHPSHSRGSAAETPSVQPSPLVLRQVDRNHYDGYIRRAQQQQRKARNEFKRSMTTKAGMPRKRKLARSRGGKRRTVKAPKVLRASGSGGQLDVTGALLQVLHELASGATRGS
eukprot:INCI1558.1.p1 GENE.INCI1558.1~~INCI1558.1.p1  ORF type:complete len:933 (-),score=174.49 INCI1558.1:20-2818(-)